MRNKILETVQKFNMINHNDAVIVGVSGGADSMTLVHFLLSVKNLFNIKIIVAHVNHCLRGEEAERDQKLVEKFCFENNLELKLLKIDVLKESKKRFLGVEECGREIRYEFFYSLAKENNCKIATAHTLSDSIETVLLNLTRGSGLKGLSGIPPVRNKIIRPLIYLTREEIETYCEKNKLSFIVDSSNLNRDYNRNKVRLDVIPILKEINPSFETSFKRLMDTVKVENDFIENVANKYLNEKVSVIKNLDVAIKTRVIIEFIKRKCEVKLEKNHVNLIIKMIDQNKGKVNIPGNFFVFIKNGHLVVQSNLKIGNKCNDFSNGWETHFDIGSLKLCDGTNILLDLMCVPSNQNCEYFVNNLKNQKNVFNNLLDYDTISKSAVFRNRRPGDFFISRNNCIRKKLKKFFNEIKFPVEKRYSAVILAKDHEVLWIEGVGVSNLCKVTKNTKNILRISLERG